MYLLRIPIDKSELRHGVILRKRILNYIPYNPGLQRKMFYERLDFNEYNLLF